MPRAYTPRPGVVPEITLEKADGPHSLTLPEDDYYVNMCRYFAASVADPGEHAANRAAIQEQSVLLEAVRTGAST